MSKTRHSRTSTSSHRTPQEIVAEWIHGVLDNVAETGKPFTFICRCPAHEDRKASLSVTVKEDGKLLLRCHANCSFNRVISAAGIQWYKGFPVIATYPYTDQSGKLLYEVLRTANKQFPICRPGNL